MSLAPYIQAVGRGPSRGRSLSLAEAADAMTRILEGTAAPEAVGALMMLLRFRGETAEEVAGFVEAVRARTVAWRDLGAVLDWPTYAAGRSRGLPLFLMSARLVARAGYPVVLHGWNSHQDGIADVRTALPAVGITVAETAETARSALVGQGIVYLPLEAVCPEALAVLRLREVLGLRSSINTVLRLANPTAAPAAVQGVFHPSYRLLQQDAARLLGDRDMLVLKGGGGEFERHPAKTIDLYGLRAGEAVEYIAPPLVDEKRRLAESDIAPDRFAALWNGEVEDAFAGHVVVGTAAAALVAVDAYASLEAATRAAEELWAARGDRRAA